MDIHKIYKRYYFSFILDSGNKTPDIIKRVISCKFKKILHFLTSRVRNYFTRIILRESIAFNFAKYSADTVRPGYQKRFREIRVRNDSFSCIETSYFELNQLTQLPFNRYITPDVS